MEAAVSTIDLLAKHNAQGVGIGEVADDLRVPKISGDDLSGVSLAISFGGDGTLLRCANLCCEAGVPILGVHFGRFGFVTQCRFEDLPTVFEKFFKGESRYQSRMMIMADISRAGAPVAALHALNEIALHRGQDGNLITVHITIDGRAVTAYPADGLLISTATGSTGYNLSVGGPILDPEVDAMVMCAIAPHTLSARPLVLESYSVVDLHLNEWETGTITADGQARINLAAGDHIRVQRSPYTTKLIAVEERDFLYKLRDRLLWHHHPLGGLS
jgi:NAD+ kinase